MNKKQEIFRIHPNGEFCLSETHAKLLNVMDEWKTWDMETKHESINGIDIIAYNFYWVRAFDNSSFEPAKCKKGPQNSLYFYFTDGSRMEVENVFEVRNLPDIKITTNLMPCPFCGNEAVVVEGHEHNFIGGYSIDLKIECSYCSANLGSSYGQYGKKITTKEEVLETLKSEWNTRV